ncbi:MAG: peptidylprolyl isomerase, partial [Acidimicrobiales bacterium]
GVFIVDLDAEAAPTTVNNFVTLARYHYYEGVAFHRIIPGFMVQGGDAVGPLPGTGGPGYQFDDELQGGEGPFYEVGSIAMANSGGNTNGSQFFVVTGDAGVGLPDQYNRFGSVTTGLDVVLGIEAAGSPDRSGQPLEEVVIESVTIIES